MIKITQNSWLGGQLDWEMTGRQDVEKYKIGATVLKNFIPMRRGSFIKRPGTDHICDISSYVCNQTTGTVNKFRMIPFSYLKDTGFTIVIKEDSARAYCSKRDIPGFTNVESGCYIDVVIKTASKKLNYPDDELDELCYCQCGDIVYIAHQNHPPCEIRHTISNGKHVFTFQKCAFNTDIKAPTVTSCTIRRCYVSKGYRGGQHYERYAASVICIDEETGGEVESVLSSVLESNNVSIAAQITNEKKFTDNDMEYSEWSGTSYFLPWTESQEHTIKVSTNSENEKIKEVRLYKDNGGVWGLIASKRNESSTWSGSKTFTFTDNNVNPDTSITPVESEKVFESAGEYPGTVAVYQQRLIWGSTKNNPARVWLSKSGDFYQYKAHKSLQLDDPIDFILPITRFAKINFIVELRKLIMFSDACEWLVGSNSDTSGITYETIMATAHSYIGCSRRLPPLICNNSVLFAERTGQAVREYQYQIEGDIYGGTDISVFSSSIFDEKAIVDWTYQQHPNSIVWCVLSDGKMASLVFMKDQKVCAWSTHEIGGNGLVKGICTTYALHGNTGSNQSTQEVLIAVERNGHVSLEKMRPFCCETDTPSNAVVMDGVRSGQVYGLTYVSKAGVSGYPFNSRMISVHPIIGNDVGNSQFDIKNVQYVHLRMQNSVGGSVRAVDMPKTQESVLCETALPEVRSDGLMRFGKVDERILLEGSNNRDGRVIIEQNEPWPFQVLLMECDVDVEEGRS